MARLTLSVDNDEDRIPLWGRSLHGNVFIAQLPVDMHLLAISMVKHHISYFTTLGNIRDKNLPFTARMLGRLFGFLGHRPSPLCISTCALMPEYLHHYIKSRGNYRVSLKAR